MTPGRLQLTGERRLPWTNDIQRLYEHLHRYRFAAEFASKRRVLDLGSGEGYGAAILARSAMHVDALDIDTAAIAHSREKYETGNLQFHEGSATDLHRFGDDSFDIVVCFEVIEHVDEQELLVHEARRVLKPEGLFFVSMPNRAVYNGRGVAANSFHARELSEAELRELLAHEFPKVAIWAQGLVVGSELVLQSDREMSPISAPSRHVVQRSEDTWSEAPATTPTYLFCMASAAELPPLPSLSFLKDEALELLRLEERHTAALKQRLLSLPVRGGPSEAEVLGEALMASRVWPLLERGLVARAGARALLGRLPVLQRFAPNGHPSPTQLVALSSTPDATSIQFRELLEPLVSIVIPVHNNLDFTLRCLHSLQSQDQETFEVIVVDDASTDATASALASIAGLRLERNQENAGFLHSCNRGASVARGRFIIFLNNDVEVQDGWLEALLDAVESAPDVGVVGSKLVYPDGRLQEAGAFIWSDATGWNYGRGEDPDAPEFNYRRDVDYCSGASLLVRRDLFEKLGGFDTRYAPAYYEDTDLCFAARAAGYRVLYEPASMLVHHEGASHGTDTRVATEPMPHSKALQHRNQHIFGEKWSDALRDQRRPGSYAGLLGGRFDDRLRVLVADNWVPAHDRDSGSLRMTWILRMLRSLDCDVTLFPDNRDRTEPYTRQLQSLGIEVLYGQKSFATFARERAGLYDLVLLSRPNVAAAHIREARRRFADALIVYDTVDLEFVRESRKREVFATHDDRRIAAMRETELRCMRSADVISAITEDEAATIGKYVDNASVIVLPNVHEVPDTVGRPFEAREDLLFIGGFDHDPNVDAVLHFVYAMGEIVKPHLDVRFWVVGSNPPDSIRALQSSSVIVTGYVADADAYFDRCRVFVAPLRYGAGMKGKIGHALALGVPVVTTSVGAEGMGLRDGHHLLIRDDPESFAAAVVELYRDRDLWEKLARNGRQVVQERWTPEAMRARLQPLLVESRSRVGPVVRGRRES